MSLNEKISAFARSKGADLVGVASTDRFDETEPDPERKARFFLGGGSAIIVIGLKVVDAVLDPLRGRPDPYSENFKGYLANYNYNLLDFIAVQTARYIEEMGYDAYPAQARVTNREKDTGVFSHKPAAVWAGLGQVGKSSLVITPEFGPRQRLVSVITDAPLKCFDGPLPPNGAICGGCKMCIEACPKQAIAYDETTRVTRVDKVRCREAMNTFPQCALCQGICPFGHTAARKRRARRCDGGPDAAGVAD